MREGLRSSSKKAKVAGTRILVVSANERALTGKRNRVVDEGGLNMCCNGNPGVVPDDQECGGELVDKTNGRTNGDDARGEALVAEDRGLRGKGDSKKEPEGTGGNDVLEEVKDDSVIGLSGIQGACWRMQRGSEEEVGGALANWESEGLGNSSNENKRTNEVSVVSALCADHGEKAGDVRMDEYECRKVYADQKGEVKEKDLKKDIEADEKALLSRLVSMSGDDDGVVYNTDNVCGEVESNASAICKEDLDRSGGRESKLDKADDRTNLKEGSMVCKAQILGKVLRSRIVAINTREKEAGGGRTSSKKRKMVTNQLKDEALKAKKHDTVQSGGVAKIKHGRGRPPKVKTEETAMRLQKGKTFNSTAASGKKYELQRERSEVKIEEDSALKVMLCLNISQENEKLEAPLSAASLKRDRVEIHSNGVEKLCADESSSIKSGSATKKLKSVDGVIDAVSDSSNLRLKNERQVKKSKSKRINHEKKVKVKVYKRKEQDLVRNKIVDLLLGAGWTIEHRPRQGRVYADAVYVCPKGRTHWSVTKAYFALQKEVEEGTIGSEPGTYGFRFVPLAQEELAKLFRVVVKKRVGKKDKNRQDDSDISDVKVIAKSVKKKLTAKAIAKSRNKSFGKKLVAKLLKGRKKRKVSSSDEEGSVIKSLKRKSFSTRDGSKNRRRCGLLVRRTNQGLHSETDEFVPYSGKRTLLSWMIDLGSIPIGGKVQYRFRTEVVCEGGLTRNGILCGCCDKVLSVSEFEDHLGHNHSQTYENLYLENGSSLLQCLYESWHKQEESRCSSFHVVEVGRDDPNDDTCALCGDGGDLICCDSCPSTFHQICLNLQDCPSGEWHCPYCSCKFCETFDGPTSNDDNDDASPASSLLTCHLCEEKYHQLCISEEDTVIYNLQGPTFCGRHCKQIFEGLQQLVGVKCGLVDQYSWTLIQRSGFKHNVSEIQVQEIEINSKLAVALSLMNECFLPVVDHRTGIDLLNNILYSHGSNFKRLSFSGFYTAILEREDEIVCAASIRIHGKHLAEMPFIGTSNAYRRQGMCRRLLNAIESTLFSLGVEKLVIPAVSDLVETWTSVFGFKPLEKSSKEAMLHLNMLVFPSTDMLEKPLLKQQQAEEGFCPASDSKCGESGHSHHRPADEGLNISEGTFDGSGANPDVCDPSLSEKYLVDPCPAVGVPKERTKTSADTAGMTMNHVHEASSHATPMEYDGGRIVNGPDEVLDLLTPKVDCQAGSSAPGILTPEENTAEGAPKLFEDTVCEVERTILSKENSLGDFNRRKEAGKDTVNEEKGGPQDELTELLHINGAHLASKALEQTVSDSKADYSSVLEHNSQTSRNLSPGASDRCAPGGLLPCSVAEVGSK
ncbi:ribosomal 40S subunit protein S18B [Dionaea muscipula]